MKKKIIDMTVALVFAVSILVLIFFWACEYDPIVTVLAFLVLGVSGLATILQYQKLKELEQMEKTMGRKKN